MTNLGGPSFFFLVVALLLTGGTPFVVGAALALVRFGQYTVERAFFLVNLAVFGVGFALIFLWTTPLLLGEEPGRALPYLLVFVGTALGVIVLLELLPIGLGILVTERRTDAPRRFAAFAASGGWVVGAIGGLIVGALLLQGFLALLGTIPGGILGAVLGGPAIYRVFNRRDGENEVRSRDAA